MQDLTFKEVFESSGMTYTEFSRFFNIPYRTLMNWASGSRACPQYLLDLMKYKIDNEKAKRENPYITFR